MNDQPPQSVDAALDLLLAPAAAPPVEAPAGHDRFRKRNLRWLRVGIFLVGVFAILVLGLYFFAWRAPSGFPKDALFTVAPGTTLSDAGKLLLQAGLIRSEFWFKTWSKVLGEEKGIQAGDYYFAAPLTVWDLIRRLASGISAILPVRITIPEGLSNTQVASLLVKSLPRLSSQRFLDAAKGKEGYLFPDTYMFRANATETQIVKLMSDTYDRKIASVLPQIRKFGKPLSDVIIMASLIEEEARTTETRQTIAGILWKRLALGMPLQVDAVFPYIFGKNTFEITTDDLAFDSPYNTYKYTGLPPTPISNPGLDSILAAVTPIETPYLYYLSDRNGVMHYAKTHMEHLVNKEKYLR